MPLFAKSWTDAGLSTYLVPLTRFALIVEHSGLQGDNYWMVVFILWHRAFKFMYWAQGKAWLPFFSINWKKRHEKQVRNYSDD